MSLYGLLSLAAVAAFCASVFVSIVLAKAGKWKLTSPNIQCVISVTLASFFFICVAFGYVLGNVGLDEEFVFEHNLKAILAGFAQIFVVLGMMTVSVTWIDLALRSKKLKTKTSSTMKKVRLAVHCVTIGLGLVVFLLISLGNEMAAGILGVVTIFLVIPS